MMKYLEFLIFISNLVFVLANYFHGSGEKEGIETWEIFMGYQMKKVDSGFPLYRDNISYIVLRTEYQLPESTENKAETDTKRKQKWINYFTSSSSKEVTKILTYYIHYSIAHSLGYSGRKLIVNSVVELIDYVIQKSLKDVIIIREISKQETNEFMNVFPNDFLEKKINNIEKWKSALNLYRVMPSNIVKIQSNGSKLNKKDAFVIDVGTELIGIIGEDVSERFTVTFTYFIAHFKRSIRRISFFKNFNEFQRKSIFFTLFNDKHLNDILEEDRTKIKEHYMLYEYSEKRFIGVTDTNNSNKLSSYNIKAGNWYILLDHLMKEIFLYITPNLKTDVINLILSEGERFALHNQNYKLSIIQQHKLDASFVIAFKDLIEFFEMKTTNEIDKLIVNQLCKY